MIVFANEKHWQLPDAGHVQAFMERSVVHSSIAKERDGDVLLLENLETVTAAASLQDTGTDDPAGSHHADLGREQVHASAPASGTSRRSTEQLRHQLARWHPFGQSMTVAAMRAEHDILMRQVCANGGRDRFLADVSMASPMNQAALMTSSQLLFGLPNELHGAIHPS